MASTRIPANYFRLFVNTATPASPTWVEVKGCQSLEVSVSAGTVSGRSFDSDGHADDIVVTRNRSIQFSGISLIDEATGAYDAGQAEIMALANEFGSAAVGDFRIVRPGDKADRFSASVTNFKPYGGNTDGLAAFTVDLAVQGDVTEETVA